MEEELYMVMDDTNNKPFDEIPVLDPETEAKAHADAEAIFSELLANRKTTTA